MSKYTVLKLTSGYDIIGKKLNPDIDTVDKYIKLESPMTMLTSSLDNGATIVFLRAYTLLSKEKVACISHNHVIVEYEPQKVLVDYYVNMIEYSKKYIEEDMIKGMKSANIIIKDVIQNGKLPETPKDQYEKSLEYWESLVKTDKNKKH
jgi:tetrahydromethanopterin S-methyltransferase subunit F